MATRHELIPRVEVLRDRTSADAVTSARLQARLAVAKVRLLEATTLRDRRAKELRELIDLAHDATASRAASTTYREGS
jgi:hypothetical protein